MAYVPEWERLADARKRVMAAGLSKGEAERDLCAAMSDGKITVRPFFELVKRTILDHQIASSKRDKIFAFMRDVRDGVHRYPEPWGDLFQAFSMKGVTPGQLDWPRSQFRNCWNVPIHPEMAPMDWNVSIELASADVTRVLIASRTAQESMTTAHAEPKKQAKAGRARPARERAKKALEAVYGNTVPDQSNEPNKVLCTKVNEWLKGTGLLEVREDSILRAAGRR